MGIVSEYVRDVIEKQVDERKLVVWFDPERHYTDFVQSLTLPHVTVVRYDNSFFVLRHQIDDLLNGDEPPRLLVYVPMSEEDTHNALIELTVAGIDIKPGHHSVNRNTRLSVIAKRALRDAQGLERAEEVARQVDAGKLSLADLDELDQVVGESPVVLTIFGTSHPRDVALQLLSSDRLDADVSARGALGDLARLLGNAFGIALESESSCQSLRQRLAQHVITTEFIASLHAPLPRSLTSVHTAETVTSRALAIELVREWRVRRDVQESYADYATRTEAVLGLATITFEIAQIRDCQTFERIETALQEAIERALVDGVQSDVIELARSRQSSYWSERIPELQARWALINVAGMLLEEAQRIETDLKKSSKYASVLLQHYVSSQQPWCQLDTHHRHLEQRWNNFDLALGTKHQTLERLVTRAKQRYMAVGGDLAEHFVRGLAASKFLLPGVQRQREIYGSYVKPALKTGKTAYVLVDALRFEMARNLRETFAQEYEVQLDVALGSVPTITEIGMASLMPNVEAEATVVAVGNGKLGLQVGNTILKDRKSRLDWFKSQHTVPVAIATLEDALAKNKRTVQQELQAAHLILITSQEIDEVAEGDNIRLARREMDNVLPDLARLINKLRDYGCKTIVVAADHGYVFADELDSDMKIDPPGGDEKDLHRRVWVGRGGSADEAYLRTPLAAFGLSDELDIAVPWGFAAFKVSGGARAYFHGGMSPQELAIPVMTLSPVGGVQAEPLAAMEWTLKPGSKKISTRFFSVQITGQAVGLLEIDSPRVHVEVRVHNEVISQPVTASYGFVEATGDVELHAADDDARAIEPNTVALNLIKETDAPSASIHLLDAATGRELQTVPTIALAITL